MTNTFLLSNKQSNTDKQHIFFLYRQNNNSYKFYYFINFIGKFPHNTVSHWGGENATLLFFLYHKCPSAGTADTSKRTFIGGHNSRRNEWFPRWFKVCCYLACNDLTRLPRPPVRVANCIPVTILKALITGYLFTCTGLFAALLPLFFSLLLLLPHFFSLYLSIYVSIFIY